MTKIKYPPISPGTIVKTTEPNWDLRSEWTDAGWASRRWGVWGETITHHDSHGLCYDVRHDDGTIGCYNPSELQVVLGINLDELQKEAEKLLSLLKDRQPGIAAWHGFLNERTKSIHSMLSRVVN